MILGNIENIEPVCGMIPIGLNEERAASYVRQPLWRFRKAVESGTMPRARFPMFPHNESVWGRQQLDCYIADDPDGFVYFIRTLQPVNGHFAVKIGTARCPKKRLVALQTSCPVNLEIVSLARGGRYDEKRLHEQFCEYRMAGEWFRLEGALLEYMRGRPTVPGE